MPDLVKYRCPSCGYSINVEYTASGEGVEAKETASRQIEEMENGLYGQEERDFFDRYPDGAISNEMALYQCQECGALSNRPKLNLYVLKKDMKPIKGRCFTNCTLATGFDLMRSYPHTCQECGGDVMMVADYRNYHRSMVMCPEGDDLLEILEE